MAITPLPEHLEVKSSMWVGGEPPYGLLRAADELQVEWDVDFFARIGLQLEKKSEPVIINTLAKFGGRDFLKLSVEEAQTDHLYILGIPDFSRSKSKMNILDEHGKLPIEIERAARELGLEVTHVVSPLHTKENWVAAVKKSNPKLISIFGEMTQDPPIPEGYVKLDNSAYIRTDYLTAICPYLSPHSELVLKAVEQGIYKPQSSAAAAKPADPTPET